MKVVVWGLPLHSHTHSYIHQAFFRASHFMGFETYWVNDVDEANEIITPGTIVIACNVGYEKLRFKEGAKYVLHNSDDRDDLKQGEFINLKVYTHEVLQKPVEDLGDLSFWQQNDKTLFQPWATDLMPSEISNIDPIVQTSSNNHVTWVGSVLWGEHGNIDELQRYGEICKQQEIAFDVVRCVSLEETIHLIRNSRHAPAIQGKWQIEKGYIPCRVFKNISYGCWTVTNSSTVSRLLEIEHNSTIDETFECAEKFVKDGNPNRIKEKMNLVSERHTYVNRLNNILKVLGK